MPGVSYSQILRTILFLMAVCFVGLPAQALYAGQAASPETSTYVFLPDQSTVLQTGGFAGVHWTYAVEGQFQLTVVRDTGTASFTHVDANATDDSPSQRTLDPNGVFNLTGLAGTVVDDATLLFAGQAPDGSDVRITVTLQDGLAYLVGRTTPPPNSADFFIFSLDAVAQRKYSGGTGEPNDPYQIATAADLIALGGTLGDYSKYFILTADIDLDPNLPGREVFGQAVIAPDKDPPHWSGVFMALSFTGVFDGKGHVVRNLHIRGGGYLGLFGQLESNAKILNLGLEGVEVQGTGDNIGGLVGLNLGKITSVYSIGMVRGRNRVGGLVGYNQWCGSIATNYSAGTVFAREGVGGLVGTSFGTITASYSTGTVTGRTDCGGLVGSNHHPGSITSCCSAGGVNGRDVVGGLVSWNGGRITTSYSTSLVCGDWMTGGFVGWNEGPIAMSYSAGAVTAKDRVGGFVARNDKSITASFWDMESSGQPNGVAGTGKTTAEMQIRATFLAAGWDFVDETANGKNDIWWVEEGRDYPRLWWELSTDGLVVFVVDDFESYTDEEGNRVFEIWTDGWDIPENGAVVGCDWPGDWQCPGIVHGGQQAMPLRYDNSSPAYYSEAARTWATPQDWAVGDALDLYFRGEAGNDREPLYVCIQDDAGRTAVIVHPDAEAVLATEWHKWHIALADVRAAGVDVAAVKKMVIGVGDRKNPGSGGAGRIYVDDIRLTKPTP